MKNCRRTHFEVRSFCFTVILTEDAGNETDSLEDEEEEELSENDHISSDVEPGIEDDSLHSPLEQHFEYLAGDPEAKGNGDKVYQLKNSSSVEAKQTKSQGFLSRCRSSISAKFLSRSQKSQTG